MNFYNCVAVSFTNRPYLHNLCHHNSTSGSTPNRNVYTCTPNCKGRNVYSSTPHDSWKLKTSQKSLGSWPTWYTGLYSYNTILHRTGQPTFSVKGQRVNILGSTGHILSRLHIFLCYFFTTLYKWKSHSQLWAIQEQAVVACGLPVPGPQQQQQTCYSYMQWHVWVSPTWFSMQEY